MCCAFTGRILCSGWVLITMLYHCHRVCALWWSVWHRNHISTWFYQKLLNCHLPWLYRNIDHWHINAASHSAVLFFLLWLRREIFQENRKWIYQNGHCFLVTSVISCGSTLRSSLTAVQLKYCPCPTLWWQWFMLILAKDDWLFT